MNYMVREYTNTINPNFRGFVTTDPINDGPLDGSYWQIMHLTMWNSDNNGQNLALYLFDSAQLITLQLAILAGANQGYIPDFSAVTGGNPPIINMHKISPGQGLGGSSAWGNFSSQRLGGGAIQHNGVMPDIFIPQRWGLYCVETNGVVSGLTRIMFLRLVLRQFKNGCAPFSQW